jgi:predicted O-linked N-acetylglucosamine transferase (SPINDLY family)
MDYQQLQQQLPELFNNWGEASCHPKSDIFKSIRTTVNSMISPNVMQLLNLAVSCLDDNEVYCEIGTFTGGSLISGLINNPDKIAYAVDNFSELDAGENFDKLTNNLEQFNLADQVFFCYQDFEEFFRDLKNQELQEKIGVYFYDASQNYRSYLLGLLHLKSVISEKCLLILTNCQWQSCQQAVRDFLNTNSEARLILDFSQLDYLLWNGIQILTWDSQQQNENDLEDNNLVNVKFQEEITYITKLETAKFVDVNATKASLLLQKKQYLEAKKNYLNLLQFAPNNPNLWQNLGTVYYEQGEYVKALNCLNKTLQIDDTSAIYHYTIGLILEKLDINQAIVAYEKAIAINPELVNAYNNLGNIYLAQNQIDQAEAIFRKSISANPLHFGGYLNLGNLFLEQRQQINEAIFYYNQAFDLNPKSADVLNNLSIAYKHKNDEFNSVFYQAYFYFKQSATEQAIKLYKQAISIDPQPSKAYLHLLWSLHSLGKNREAIEEITSALELLPNNFSLQIVALHTIPPIYQDIEEIELCRKFFQERLKSLCQNLVLSTELKFKDSLQEAINKQTNFYLAYQGKNDICLQKQYGQIVHKIMAANYPQWCQELSCPQLRPGEKIRVGYISTHLHNHNGANGCLGWVKHHTRQDFQIYSYYIGANRDNATEKYQLSSYSFVHIPNDLEAVCQQIIADKLHILVFPAIGMDPLNGLIAALRLAPIQCMAWGHPVTSGLPTMDYFLSSELMEPENGEEHYSETLIRLPNSSLCYEKPVVPGIKKTRSEFGIPEDCLLYLSCQSTFKYLPQYDYIFAEIAKAVNNAKFVFISAPQGKHITNIFEERLEKAFAKLGLNSEDYCIILPRQSHYEFMQLNQIADIYLDTFAWSGGFTTLNAIACNLPIVTCPGEFMRGRHSYAFLKMLGITETIASSEAEYIEIAVKLGLDADFRNSIVERTSQNHNRVFNDQTAVEGLEAFYKQVVQEKLLSNPYYTL